MSSGPSHLAVVPAYNEAATVSSVVRAVRRYAPAFDVLVVDDGSTDDTERIAQDTGARVLRHPFNLGIGGAVQSGYQFALEHGYDVAVQVDGDGQHDPSQAPALLAALEQADLVIGARFAGTGDYDVRGPRRWSWTKATRSASWRTGCGWRTPGDRCRGWSASTPTTPRSAGPR